MTADRNLFRSQAIKFKSENWSSALLPNESGNLRVFVWLIILSFLAIFALLMGSTYKETERARGILKPEGGLQKLLAPRGSRVSEIFVEVGQKLEKGQLLAELSSSRFDNEGTAKYEIEIERLLELRKILEDEREIKEAMYVRAQQANQFARKDLQASKQSIVLELEILGSKLVASERNLHAMEALLENRAISRLRFDQQQAGYLGLVLQQEELRQDLHATGRQLSELDLAKDLAALDSENMSLRLRSENQRISYEIAQLEQGGIDSIVAESPGEVAAITTDEGQTVRAGELMFYLVPENKALRAEIYVSSKVQGRVEPGQRVMLGYDGFNYQSYGRYDATVTEIGQVSLDPREHLLPLSLQSVAVFKIVATLNQEYVEGPDIHRLQRDMEFSAEFVVAEMSLLGFIFKPLLAMKGKVW